MSDLDMDKIIGELRLYGVRIATKPTKMVLSKATREIAERYGLNPVVLVEKVLAHRKETNRTYMRNYMRRRRAWEKENG